MKIPAEVNAEMRGRKLFLDGKPVRDATKAVKLVITEEDLRYAQRKNARTCAAAHAFSRDNEIQEAIVQRGRTYLLRKDAEAWERYETPYDLKRETIAFDRGGRMETGEFYLKPTKPSDRLGVARERKYTGERPPRGKLIRKKVRGVRSYMKIVRVVV